MSAALPTTLTLAHARGTVSALREELERLPAGAAWTVDARALQEFDTSALAVLLELRRAAQARSCTLQVASAPEQLGQLAALYGVGALLGLQPSA